jgi:hypothetical protein
VIALLKIGRHVDRCASDIYIIEAVQANVNIIQNLVFYCNLMTTLPPTLIIPNPCLDWSSTNQHASFFALVYYTISPLVFLFSLFLIFFPNNHLIKHIL